MTIVGAMIYALLVGTISGFSLGLDSGGRKYREKLDEVNEFMEASHFPTYLKDDIVSFFRLKYHGRYFDKNSTMGELNWSLQREILLESFGGLVDRVPFFQRDLDDGRDDDFIYKIALVSKHEYFVQGNTVFCQGQKGEHMYFIVHGTAEIVVDGNVVGVLSDGSFFGEVALMESSPRSATIRASSPLTLVGLSKCDLEPILDEFFKNNIGAFGGAELNVTSSSSASPSSTVATPDTAFRDVISMVLGASIPMGLHNLMICIRQAYIRPNWLNVMQCIASFCQLANQFFFIIMFTQPADSFFKLNCAWFSSLSEVFFFLYQILSVTVLLMRTTGLVVKKLQRQILRASLFFFLAVSIGFVLYSAIFKVNLIIDNRCVVVYQRTSNLLGKIILFGVYVALLLVFSIPAVAHIKTVIFECSGDDIAEKTKTVTLLLRIVMSVSIRIILAILGFLITVILSFANVWGNYFFIEFTIQNYLGITSSTFEATPGGVSDKAHTPQQQRQQYQQQQQQQQRRPSANSSASGRSTGGQGSSPAISMKSSPSFPVSTNQKTPEINIETTEHRRPSTFQMPPTPTQVELDSERAGVSRPPTNSSRHSDLYGSQPRSKSVLGMFADMVFLPAPTTAESRRGSTDDDGWNPGQSMSLSAYLQTYRDRAGSKSTMTTVSM
ncbi:Potassium voltage-gated channel sub H member 7 [Phlyctochytrium planicorne]|nr:Potassium voltage-gated channel sub H member 7 [Phlyctochytrium planicorne]